MPAAKTCHASHFLPVLLPPSLHFYQNAHRPPNALPYSTGGLLRLFPTARYVASRPQAPAATHLHLDQSLPSVATKEQKESDDDLFTVPDLESRPADSGKTSTAAAQQAAAGGGNSAATTAAGKRRRGRNPAEKEYKRMKRLLRNRVSAQQARERKKVYVNDLESKAGELQDKNAKLEEKILTLINENTMLRKVLMNTRPKVDESAEPQNDQ